MENYYSKENEGGPAASRGFEYQDLCAIKYFLERVDDEDFLSLTLEQVNDFSLLFKRKEIVFQVKDYKPSKKEIDEILYKLNETTNTENFVIAPAWSSDFSKILLKKEEYLNACLSQRYDNQIMEIERQLESIISKSGYNSNVKHCNFKIINREDQEEIILYRIHKWNQKHGYESDENLMLSQLVKMVKKQRGLRGSLKQDHLISIAQSSKVDNCRYIPQKRLSTNKENILASLRVFSKDKVRLKDLIDLIIVYIEEDKYERALEALNKLEIETKDVEIYKAWVLLILGRYKEVKEICDNILKCEKETFYDSAFYYKGIVEYNKKKYLKAYKYISKSIELGKEMSCDQATYLAKTEIRLNKNLDEARQLLEQCIATSNDDPEIYYELACLSKPHESIDLLKLALKLDSNCFKARLMLAEYYRMFGYDPLAYNEYKMYFSDYKKIENWKALQGMIYCLINMGRIEEAEAYILPCINSFINSRENIIKDHQSIVIMDLTWNGTNLLVCTKENNMYKFHWPLGTLCIPVRKNYSSIRNKDGMGVIPDKLLFMCEYMKNQESKEKFDIENTWKPVFIANYDDDFLLLSKKHSLIKNGVAHLNHDHIEIVNNNLLLQLFYKMKVGDEIHYQEYIIYERDVEIRMYEYDNCIQVHTIFKSLDQQFSTFIKGNGYFNFRKALENANWLSWYLYSVNRKELIDLCIPTKCVKIKCC